MVAGLPPPPAAPVPAHIRGRALAGRAAAADAGAAAAARGGGPAPPAQYAEHPRKGGKDWFGTDSRESPFDELKLPTASRGMGRLRVRQHVNPLRAEYQQATDPIDWAAAFEDPSLPLVVDLGCGPGRFLLLLQRRGAAGEAGAVVPGGGRCNFLGVEIRRPLVERANAWAELLGCKGSVHYEFSNATVSLATMLSGYPGPVSAFFAQFPDPHFKRRHKKRRLLQADTVRAMADALAPGGAVFLQSDILQAAEGLRDAVEEAASDAFDLAPQHSEPGATFLAASPEAEAAAAAAVLKATGAPAAAPAAAGAPAARAAGSGRRASEAGGGAAGGWDFTDTAAAAWEGGGGGGGGGGSGDGDSGDEDAGPRFVSKWAEAGWLRGNPVGVPTEREYYVAATQGAPVYRVLLLKR